MEVLSLSVSSAPCVQTQLTLAVYSIEILSMLGPCMIAYENPTDCCILKALLPSKSAVQEKGPWANKIEQAMEILQPWQDAPLWNRAMLTWGDVWEILGMIFHHSLPCVNMRVHNNYQSTANMEWFHKSADRAIFTCSVDLKIDLGHLSMWMGCGWRVTGYGWRGKSNK